MTALKIRNQRKKELQDKIRRECKYEDYLLREDTKDMFQDLKLNPDETQDLFRAAYHCFREIEEGRDCLANLIRLRALSEGTQFPE